MPIASVVRRHSRKKKRHNKRVLNALDIEDINDISRISYELTTERKIELLNHKKIRR